MCYIRTSSPYTLFRRTAPAQHAGDIIYNGSAVTSSADGSRATTAWRPVVASWPATPTAASLIPWLGADLCGHHVSCATCDCLRQHAYPGEFIERLGVGRAAQSLGLTPVQRTAVLVRPGVQLAERGGRFVFPRANICFAPGTAAGAMFDGRSSRGGSRSRRAASEACPTLTSSNCSPSSGNLAPTERSTHAATKPTSASPTVGGSRTRRASTASDTARARSEETRSSHCGKLTTRLQYRGGSLHHPGAPRYRPRGPAPHP